MRYADGLEDAVAGASVIVIATPDPAFSAVPALLDRRETAADVTILDCWDILAQVPARARIVRLAQN